MIRTLSLAALAMTAAPATGQEQRFGINLAGCEFGAGVALCPNKADVDWYAKAGFTLIRIPLKDNQFTAPEIVAVTRYAQAKGLEVILDRHDYKYHAPADAIAFWAKVLPLYSSDTLIELANEPVKGYPAGNVWDSAAKALNPTVQGIRALGYRHRILVGWPGYSAIFRADKNEAARKGSDSFLTALDRVGGLQDPLNRTFLSGHRYFDKNSSGTSATCAPYTSVDAFAAAARKRGLKAYLTEFAWGSYRGVPASCAPVGKAFMAAVKANSDVIVGTTAWGGGRAWKEDYLFKVEPKKGTRDAVAVPAYVRQLAGQ